MTKPINEPKAVHCHHCDYGHPGYRGMDRCAKCDGTGSVFLTKSGRTFPNTEEGYNAALKESGHG